MEFATPYLVPATFESFNEDDYLAANKDIRDAIAASRCLSARIHFDTIGHTENRLLAKRLAVLEAKKIKTKLIYDLLIDKEKVLNSDAECGALDCLPNELRILSGIAETDAISQHDYDGVPLDFITKNPDAWILDAGAGLRPVYYKNVVNFEIVPYDTTDVLGVGEHLPFKSNAFDYIISSAVLEHVKDPIACAREMYRVLKPGGQIFIAAPFLFPYHGYPHHYFNMTVQGVRSLFPKELEDVDQYVPHYFRPIWAVQHFFALWAASLSGAAKEELLNMRVHEFLSASVKDYSRPCVSELSEEMNTILAYGSILTGRKPK